MKKFELDAIEFYITNVCNLSCSNCRTFNNFVFRGHYKFCAELYQPWAEILNLKNIEILGGEPTLNPMLREWIIGIRNLWPDTEINLVTNGTRLRPLKWLHDVASEYKINIKISAHSQDIRPTIVDEVFSAFGHCKLIGRKRQFDNGGPVNCVEIISNKGVKILFQSYEHFQISPFRNKQFEFYNSDPEKAHRNCKIANCHHMIDGRLYKCGFVSTAAEFFAQHNRPVPNLLQQYRPLSAEDVTSQQVLDKFQKHIPQCSLCHESNPITHIDSKLKKNIKIYNLTTINKISE